MDTINNTDEDELRIILYIWLEDVMIYDYEGIHMVTVYHRA